MARDTSLEFTGKCRVLEGGEAKFAEFTFQIDGSPIDVRKRRCRFTDLRPGFGKKGTLSGLILMDEDQLRGWAEKILSDPLTHQYFPHQALPKDPTGIPEAMLRLEREWGPPRRPSERSLVGERGGVVAFGSVVLGFESSLKGEFYKFNALDYSLAAACELAAYVRSDKRWDSHASVPSAAALVVRPVTDWNGDDLKSDQPLVPPRLAERSKERAVVVQATTGQELTIPDHYNSVLSVLCDLIELIPRVQKDKKDSRVDLDMLNLVAVLKSAAGALTRFQYVPGREGTLKKWLQAYEAQVALKKRAVEEDLTTFYRTHRDRMLAELEELEAGRTSLKADRLALVAEREAFEKERAAFADERRTAPAVSAEPARAAAGVTAAQIQAAIQHHKRLSDEQRAAEKAQHDAAMKEIEAIWLEAQEALEAAQRLAPAVPQTVSSGAAYDALLSELKVLVSKHQSGVEPAANPPMLATVSEVSVVEVRRDPEVLAPKIQEVTTVLAGVSEKIQRARDARPVYS